MFGKKFFEVLGFIMAIFILVIIFSDTFSSNPPQNRVAYTSPTSENPPTLLSGTSSTKTLSETQSATSTVKVPASHSQSPVNPEITSSSPQTPAQDTPPTTLTDQQISQNFEQVNTLARSALVNILCTTAGGGIFEPISGSGVIISPDGVILTNAHIAEYFLLQNFNGEQNTVVCQIRTGAPARLTYNASLIYLPLIWLENNKDTIISSNPTGTGEHDYAFLKITSNIDGSPVTSPLPYLSLDTQQDTIMGDPMLLASYPASFLGGISIQEDLFPESAISNIAEIFTFATNTIDVFSVPGTIVSQKGSSGGAAVDANGQLAGIITTSSTGNTTSDRDLRAISLSYINRDLKTQENFNISTILENPDQIKNDFDQNIAPTLIQILTNTILGQ